MNDHVLVVLGTRDRNSPFPEEANRRIVDLLTDLHFAPTERARGNLLREGVNPTTVHMTGNTVIDALNHAISVPYDVSSGPLAVIPFERRVVLVTAHRRESFGRGLAAICRALKQLADDISDIQIVYPVHMNPNDRTAAVLCAILGRGGLAAGDRYAVPPPRLMDVAS